MRRAITLALLVGCGGAADPPDARGGDAWPACAASSLELGRCVDPSGAPCTGALDEVRGFAELSDAAGAEAIVGPQGSSMFVLAARTSGIVPGDPDDPASPDNPLVEIIIVSASDAPVARYRGRAGFIEDGVTQLAAGLFVVIDGTELTGARLRARGTLIDVTGATRCGQVEFVAR